MTVLTHWFQASTSLRTAARGLAAAPGYTCLATALLAAGIGVMTALSSMVHAVVVRPLPFEHSDRLVELSSTTLERRGGRLPLELLAAIQSRTTSVEAVAIHGPVSAVLHTAAGAVRLFGDRVSWNYLDVVGAAPVIGRGFLPDDERRGAPATAVISTALWRDQFDGAETVLGTTMYLDDRPFVIVGVMPPEFRTAFRGRTKDYWTPTVSDTARLNEEARGVEAVGRLRAGATVDEARADLAVLAMAVDAPEWQTRARTIAVVPLIDDVVGASAVPLIVLLSGVALVLVVSCVNLAQLTLARAEHRLDEFAVRKALGARSSTLFGAAFLESVLIAGAGGVAAVPVSAVVLPVLVQHAPTEIPRLGEASVDLTTGLTAVAIAGIAACLVGAAAAWRLSHPESVGRVQSSRAATRYPPIGRALVLVQVAASMVFLTLAAVTIDTFWAVRPDAPGFSTKGRFIFPLSVPTPSPFATLDEQWNRLDAVTDRLRTAPGVHYVALAANIAFADDDESSKTITVASPGQVAVTSLPSVLRRVSAEWFDVVGVTVTRGRRFTRDDRHSTRGVAIVNETMARRLEPAGEILGARLAIPGLPLPHYEVIGVSPDTRHSALDLRPINEVIIPIVQTDESLLWLVLHATVDTATLTESVWQAVHAVAPAIALTRGQAVVSLDDVVQRSVAVPRLSALLMSVSAAATLLLSLIGTIALVAFTTSTRRHEFAIRLALGATPAANMLTAMQPMAMSAMLGVALGSAAAAAIGRIVAAPTAGIGIATLYTMVLTSVFVLGAVALAGCAAARMVRRIDPMAALREQ